QRKENVDKVETLGRRLLALLGQYYRTVDEGGVFTFLDIENLRKESEAILSRFSETIGQFVMQEREIQKGGPLDEARLRDILKQAIVWASLLNIALAAVLTYSFNKNTSKRLNILMDNTQKFASGQQLNQAVAGSDEIGQLDKVFHAMADKLSEAARQ